MSQSELAQRLDLSATAVSKAVLRGKALAMDNDYQLGDLCWERPSIRLMRSKIQDQEVDLAEYIAGEDGRDHPASLHAVRRHSSKVI